MSISIHIPFYNPNPEKKEGHRNLRRFDYLKENIENLKTLSIKNDIFVHTHNEFLDDKKLSFNFLLLLSNLGFWEGKNPRAASDNTERKNKENVKNT